MTISVWTIWLFITTHGTQGDTKEGLYFGREVPADAEEASKPFHGPNQWPPEVRQPPPESTLVQDAFCNQTPAPICCWMDFQAAGHFGKLQSDS